MSDTTSCHYCNSDSEGTWRDPFTGNTFPYCREHSPYAAENSAEIIRLRSSLLLAQSQLSATLTRAESAELAYAQLEHECQAWRERAEKAEERIRAFATFFQEWTSHTRPIRESFNDIVEVTWQDWLSLINAVDTLCAVPPTATTALGED